MTDNFTELWLWNISKTFDTILFSQPYCIGNIYFRQPQAASIPYEKTFDKYTSCPDCYIKIQRYFTAKHDLEHTLTD